VLRVVRAELGAGGNKAGGITEVVADANTDHNVDGVALENEESDDIGKLQLPALAESKSGKGGKTARSNG